MDPMEINQTGEISEPSKGTGVNGPIITPIISTKNLISTPGSSKCTVSAPVSSPDIPKILSRNGNGTVVFTSTPSNDAELQLYRVLQRASLLSYYDTLLEMGGDDLQQLCEAGEEEFLEIMALVGMAGKPLHVRRLQKTLQEWATRPAMFQTPLDPTDPTSLNNCANISNIHLVGTLSDVTPKASTTPNNISSISNIPPVSALPVLTPAPSTTFSNNLNQTLPPSKDNSPSNSPDHTHGVSIKDSCHKELCTRRHSSPKSILAHQGTSSALLVTPVLVEAQIARLEETARALVKALPQFEPKPHNTKKKICRALETVMNMPVDDPCRMDEIRKYAAIYGRFDCKRKPHKPLTIHELSVNEAAAQICRFSPALLTRRDDLFSLARQVVRDSGYICTKAHPSGTGYRTCSHQTSNKNNEDYLYLKKPKVDIRPSMAPIANDSFRLKRQERLEQIAAQLKVLGDKAEELVQAAAIAAQEVGETSDISIDILQQQIEAVQTKQTQFLLEQSDLLKQALPSRCNRQNNCRLPSNQNDSEKHDSDSDSQISISNTSSLSFSSLSQDGGGSTDSLIRDCTENLSSYSGGSPSVKNTGKIGKQYMTEILAEEVSRNQKDDFYFQDGKVQVISSSGGNIIAVANPALSMSSAILQSSVGDPDCPLPLIIENHKPD